MDESRPGTGGSWELRRTLTMDAGTCLRPSRWLGEGRSGHTRGARRNASTLSARAVRSACDDGRGSRAWPSRRAASFAASRLPSRHVDAAAPALRPWSRQADGTAASAIPLHSARTMVGSSPDPASHAAMSPDTCNRERQGRAKPESSGTRQADSRGCPRWVRPCGLNPTYVNCTAPPATTSPPAGRAARRAPGSR